MLKNIFTSLLLILVCVVPCFALSEYEAKNTGTLVTTGPYRYMDFKSASITGENDGSNADTLNIDFPADFILISWGDSTNELHVQFYTDDGDSSFVEPSDVYLINAEEAIPFYARDVRSIKVNLPYDGDSGLVRVWAYKI